MSIRPFDPNTWITIYKSTRCVYLNPERTIVAKSSYPSGSRYESAGLAQNAVEWSIWDETNHEMLAPCLAFEDGILYQEYIHGQHPYCPVSEAEQVEIDKIVEYGGLWHDDIWVNWDAMEVNPYQFVREDTTGKLWMVDYGGCRGQ